MLGIFPDIEVYGKAIDTLVEAKYAGADCNNPKDLSCQHAAPRVTWAGVRHINKLLLFGTPNTGSFYAFSILTKGYKIAGRSLPFVDDLGIDDVFTIPSLYQLTPHRSAARFWDENLKPININLYNSAVWRKYGLGTISDAKFLTKLKDPDKIPNVEPIKNRKIRTVDDRILADATSTDAQNFLTAVLNRARYAILRRA